MLKNYAFLMLKPLLVDWLLKRALTLPAQKREEISRKAGISVEQLQTIEEVYKKFAVSQIDSILK